MSKPRRLNAFLVMAVASPRDLYSRTPCPRTVARFLRRVVGFGLRPLRGTRC